MKILSRKMVSSLIIWANLAKERSRSKALNIEVLIVFAKMHLVFDYKMVIMPI
jgi:hypothetical protein